MSEPSEAKNLDAPDTQPQLEDPSQTEEVKTGQVTLDGRESTPSGQHMVPQAAELSAALKALTDAVRDLKPSNRPKPNSIALVVAILGLMVSVVAQLLTFRATTDQSVRDSVERSYSTWLQVSKMQLDYPDIAHMFALPADYYSARDRVKALNKQLSPADRERFLLRERGAAVFFFTMYEASLYQEAQADKTLDPRRTFYAEVVQYCEDKPLRNPRIIWWWLNGVSNYFEVSTQQRYQSHVLAVGTNSIDASGPF